jgi:hypothetical protein
MVNKMAARSTSHAGDLTSHDHLMRLTLPRLVTRSLAGFVTTRGGACCFRSSICGSLSRRSGLAGKLPSAVIFGHARQWRPSPGRGHPRSTG